MKLTVGKSTGDVTMESAFEPDNDLATWVLEQMQAPVLAGIIVLDLE